MKNDCKKSQLNRTEFKQAVRCIKKLRIVKLSFALRMVLTKNLLDFSLMKLNSLHVLNGSKYFYVKHFKKKPLEIDL